MMADFCQDCSIAMFGKDYKELAELMPKEKYDDETGALALCECCGPIVVNFAGKRMSKDYFASCTCGEKHGEETQAEG